MLRQSLWAGLLIILGPFLTGASCHPLFGWALPFVIVILAVAWLVFMLGPGRRSRTRDSREEPGPPRGREGAPFRPKYHGRTRNKNK